MPCTSSHSEKMEISLNFFWYFFYILSKREKWIIKYPACRFHMKGMNRSPMWLSLGEARFRGSLGGRLHFSNWTRSGERVWKLKETQIAEAEVEEKKVLLLQKSRWRAFFVCPLVSKYQYISKQQNAKKKKKSQFLVL